VTRVTLARDRRARDAVAVIVVTLSRRDAARGCSSLSVVVLPPSS
jgi:hypothetical protein